MAEAVAALSLAANIIQVTDFGFEFVSSAWKIWRSGGEGVEALTTLQTLSQSLKDVALQLRVDLPTSDLRVASNRGIFDAAGECSKAAQEILDSLDKIGLPSAPQGRKRDAARAAFKLVWRGDDIKALQTRLESVRNQLTLNLAASLRQVMACFPG